MGAGGYSQKSLDLLTVFYRLRDPLLHQQFRAACDCLTGWPGFNLYNLQTYCESSTPLVKSISNLGPKRD